MSRLTPIAAALVALVIVGCATVSTRVVPLDPALKFAPSQRVEILLEKPPRPYTGIALLESRGMVGGGESELLEDAREKARALGADAIIRLEVEKTLQPPVAIYDPPYSPFFPRYSLYRYLPRRGTGTPAIRVYDGGAVMKQLKVSLLYSSSDYTPKGNTRSSPLALPLRVLDAEGGLIAEGVASGMQAADFRVPPDFETVFVRLTWPSGKSQTRRVNFEGRDSAEIEFTDSTIARNEWSAWAVPRLNPLTSLARSDEPPNLNIDRYDRVWLRLWQFWSGSWVHARVTPAGRRPMSPSYAVGNLSHGAKSVPLP